MEGQPVDPLDLVLVQEQTVERSQASESVLVQAPQVVPVKEQMAQVVEVHERVIREEL